ncbi:uncharacterized protein [Montipora foliosa]|uniref:uncharacterized protein n=1 Tax=Montipora foliosa TaxID=591990 RepID=UPI0035F1E901
MFSWNKKHRPIHEEAMMHFLDPRKRGQKFVCQKKTQAKNNPVTPNVPSRPTQETAVIPVDNKVENQGNVMEANASVDGTDSTSPQEFTELSRTTHPKGTVLLSTIMQNGAISYRSADVKVWMDGRKWRVSDNEARRLQQEWRSSPTTQLELVADDEGKVQVIVKDESTFFQRVWLSLSGFISG